MKLFLAFILGAFLILAAGIIFLDMIFGDMPNHYNYREYPAPNSEYKIVIQTRYGGGAAGWSYSDLALCQKDDDFSDAIETIDLKTGGVNVTWAGPNLVELELYSSECKRPATIGHVKLIWVPSHSRRKH